MYAQLGSVQFELLPVETLEEKFGYEFPEHQVIEGKPKLQYIGDKLDETSIGIRFHFSFCDPASKFAELKAEADKHEALQFFFADGSNGGWRVVTEITKTLTSTADNGRPLCIEAKLQLKEFDSPEPLTAAEAAKKQTAAALTGKGPINNPQPVPGNSAALTAGQAIAAAKQIQQANGKSLLLADQLKAQFPSLTGIANTVTGNGQQIGATIAPMMTEARAMAKEATGAAEAVQGYSAQVAGLSSAITRITSGLPAPANILGNKIAALNRQISGKSTEVTTLASVARGGAIETDTRALMITRMMPGEKR